SLSSSSSPLPSPSCGLPSAPRISPLGTFDVCTFAYAAPLRIALTTLAKPTAAGSMPCDGGLLDRFGTSMFAAVNVPVTVCVPPPTGGCGHAGGGGTAARGVG